MARMTFTKPQRKRLALEVARIFGEAMGLAIELAPDPVLGGLDPDFELDYRRECFETVNGLCKHLHLNVTPRGLDVHIKFGDPKRAGKTCYDINTFSGKWNHYVWPEGMAGEGARLHYVQGEAQRIAAQVVAPS